MDVSTATQAAAEFALSNAPAIAIGGLAALYAYKAAHAPPAFARKPIGNPAKSLVEPSSKELSAMMSELKQSFERHRTSARVDKGRWDYAWRIHQLQSLVLLLEENDAALLQAAKKDIGRTSAEWFLEKGALQGDLTVIINGLWGFMGPQARGTPLWMQPASSYVQAEPLGVALVIGAWNVQVALCILPLAAALSAGNAVVVKPSELAPEQSKLLAELLPKYLDPEAVRVVEGGPEVSKALVALPWDFVFYTGGGKVGALIGASCASRLIPFALELGGKSPTIVDSSANLLVTARRVVQAKFVNSGQICIAPDYILVVGDKARERQVVEAFAEQIKWQLGNDPQKSTNYARIINDNHFARVQKLLKSGGHVVHGGKSDPTDRYQEPTLVTDVPTDCALMQEEIFGPVLPILRVASVDEAIKFINDRPKPLALYVFADDYKVANHVVSRTTAGSMCINEALFQVCPAAVCKLIRRSVHFAAHPVWRRWTLGQWRVPWRSWLSGV